MEHVRPKGILAGGRCLNPSTYTPPGTKLSAVELPLTTEPSIRMPLTAQLLVVMLPTSSDLIASAMVVAGWMEVLVDLCNMVHFGLKTARVEQYCHSRP